jgi:hypothetical protein
VLENVLIVQAELVLPVAAKGVGPGRKGTVRVVGRNLVNGNVGNVVAAGAVDAGEVRMSPETSPEELTVA